MPEKICLYPIDESSIHIIRNRELFKDFELVYGIIPKGWKITGLVSSAETLIYEEEFVQDNLVENIDTVILCNSEFITKETIYRQFAEYVQKSGKRVIATREVANRFKGISDIEKIDGPLWSRDYLLEEVIIDKPVIMVAGAGENCEKSEIQIQLSDFFTEMGYKPSLIHSNSIGNLFGAHLYPQFVWDEEVPFKNKVKQLLRYVKSIEIQENPDVIIMGVPGASSKFNKYVDCGYGYLQYLMFTAIKPDAVILSLFCGDYSEEQFDLLKNIYKYRYNAEVKYFHISQNVCDYDQELNRLSFFSVDTSYVKDHFLKNEGVIFNVQDSHSKRVVFDAIMKELQNNITVM